jgi:hypothetical protein
LSIPPCDALEDSGDPAAADRCCDAGRQRRCRPREAPSAVGLTRGIACVYEGIGLGARTRCEQWDT